MVQERQTEAPEQQPERQGDAAQEEAQVEALQTPGPVEAAEAEVPEQMTVLLEDARAKADEHWDQLLRTRAEMENLKRRHTNELEKAHKFALDGFVRDLLAVRDSLELGHDAALDEKADLEKLREGTELTLKLLSDVMAKFGVEQIDPMGEPFNPEYHQAMTIQPRNDVPPNTVVTVVQKGYSLNGRLVRAAMVIVSAAGP